MKKIFLHIFYIILLFSIDFFALVAQNNEPELSDNLVILTDRTLYIVGENILFTASIIKEKNILSKVLYVELITYDGEAVSSGKYEIKNQLSEGCLKIPEKLISGIYYIKTYTKYMRNYGPHAYCYIPIKVINPFEKDVYSSKVNNQLDTLEYHMQKPEAFNSIELTSDKKEYSTREPVEIAIKGIDKENGYLKNICLAVVPAGSLIAKNLVFTQQKPLNFDNYSHETRGTSLTGKIIENTHADALKTSIANISIAEEKDFVPKKTDSIGKFYYDAPYYKGVKEVFLSSGSIDSIKPDILVDKDFCSETIKFPTTTFNLSDTEAKIAYHMALSLQLNKYFKDKNLEETSDSASKYNIPFYGEPSETIFIDDYIDLPTLAEFFYELFFYVKIKKHRGKRYFQIKEINGQVMLNEPLILLDYVAINDPEKIMNIKPNLIFKIDVVNEYYLKGNITYGGIINVISKNNDYAGVDLPSSGVFIDYNFLNDNFCFLNEQYPDHIPDTRNTLYWNPNLNLNDHNEIKFQFNTSDVPGEYQVVIRGVNENGTQSMTAISFLVKTN